MSRVTGSTSQPTLSAGVFAQDAGFTSGEGLACASLMVRTLSHINVDIENRYPGYIGNPGSLFSSIASNYFCLAPQTNPISYVDVS